MNTAKKATVSQATLHYPRRSATEERNNTLLIVDILLKGLVLTEDLHVIATIAALESTVNEYQKTKDGKKETS